MPSSSLPNDSSGIVLLSRRQAIATITCAWIPCLFLLLVGSFLFVTPITILQNFFSCFIEEENDNNDDEDNKNHNNYHHHTINALDILLSRLAGGVLIAQFISCISLLYPMAIGTIMRQQHHFQDMPTTSSSSNHTILVTTKTNLDKFRSAIASLSILGLLMVLIGLVDDRTNRDDEHCVALQSSYIIGSGAFILVLECASMMISFWPYHHHEEEHQQQQPSRRTNNAAATTTNNQQQQQQQQLTIPLLSSASTEEHTEDAEPASENGVRDALVDNNTNNFEQQQGMEADDNSNAVDMIHTISEEDQPSAETTSRIRGTLRLLKLATSQVFYLYIGCAVLLIRLPFSLSIPHFVSTTLGAVSRGDFDGAKVEILLLFILGVSFSLCWGACLSFL